jgi:membrane protein implicated in regulation of membrane protease activity
VVAFALGIGVYLLETQDKVHFTKNPDAPFTSLILALACGVFLLGSTLIGRRAPVGFVALLAFLIFGTTSFALGLPFLALAAWLLWRSYKIQKEAATKVKESRAAASNTTRATTRETRSGTARTAKTPTKGSSSKAQASTRQEPNKRYTPKRPPPPAPKPSRRERKAAQAPD